MKLYNDMKLHNGMVWKNNVNMHCGAKSDGVSQRKRECQLCGKEIGDFETVLFCFLGRGTQFMTSAYIHKECEVKHIPLPFRKSSFCRICGKIGGIDGCVPLRNGRKMTYHRACLIFIQQEIVEEEKILKSATRRVKSRVDKQTAMYFIDLTVPYEGLKLQYIAGGLPAYYLLLELRTVDGRVNYCRCYRYYEASLYCDYGRFIEILIGFENSNLPDHSLRMPEDCETRAKLAIADLQKHYDTKGYPIGQRLDMDQRMRFLIKNGNTIEGIITDTVETAQAEFQEIKSEEEK